MATTLNSGKQTTSPIVSHAWDEFIRVLPIYQALIRQCELPDRPGPTKKLANAIFFGWMKWTGKCSRFISGGF